MPLVEVVRRILGRDDIPFSDGSEADARQMVRALQQIREKARLGIIDAFGGVGFRTTKPAEYDNMVRERIPPDFWAARQIEPLEFLRDQRGMTYDLNDINRYAEYFGVWFDRRQIDRIWPPPRKRWRLVKS
jgi:hypothetical protein